MDTPVAERRADKMKAAVGSMGRLHVSTRIWNCFYVDQVSWQKWVDGENGSDIWGNITYNPSHTIANSGLWVSYLCLCGAGKKIRAIVQKKCSISNPYIKNNFLEAENFQRGWTKESVSVKGAHQFFCMLQDRTKAN